MTGQYLPPKRLRQNGHGLRGLAPPLCPALPEIGIDKFGFNLDALWAPTSAASCNASGDFHDLIGTNTTETGWFCQPHRRNGNVTHQLLKRNTSTLSKFKIVVFDKRPDARAGAIKLQVYCNPTRTAHHLMSRLPSGADFKQWCTTLSPHEFFAQCDVAVPRSSDGNDNWISDPLMFYGDLQTDQWSPFLSLFSEKLASLITELLCPVHASQLENQAPDISIIGGGYRVSVLWGSAKIMACETYFERRTTTAMESMRSAAVRAITVLESAEIARYQGADRIDSIARQASSLSVRQEVSTRYQVALYAKQRGRIRFELRKKKAATFLNLPTASSAAEFLTHRMQFQRQEMPNVLEWSNFQPLFASTNAPTVPVLCQLIDYVLRAGEECGYRDRTLLNDLLTNGSVPRVGNGEGADATLSSLLARGVLVRSKIRPKRDVKLTQQRLSLSPRYMPLVDAFTSSED